MNETEIWRPVVGYGVYGEHYEVSNLGRLRSIDKVLVRNRPGETKPYLCRGRILRPRPARNGYYQAALVHRRQRVQPHLHRLVALAFVGPPPSPAHEINHKDGNKINNRAENLEWVLHVDNMRHAWDTGLRRLKLTPEQTATVRALHSKGHSTSELAEAFNVSQAWIWKLTRRAA